MGLRAELTSAVAPNPRELFPSEPLAPGSSSSLFCAFVLRCFLPLSSESLTVESRRRRDLRRLLDERLRRASSSESDSLVLSGDLHRLDRLRRLDLDRRRGERHLRLDELLARFLKFSRG